MEHNQPSPAIVQASNEETPLLADPEPAGQRPSGEGSEPEELSNGRLAVVFGSIWIIIVLTALDSTIVATLTAVISTSFSSFNQLSWLGSTYLVATAASQPLAGRWTDAYGRRRGLLVAGLTFGIGTLICGVATEEWVFILGRAIAGAGGGASNAVSTFVGADLVPLRKRGIIQGINNVAMGCGTGLGGLLGGVLNDLLGWRAAFLIQIPLVALGLGLCSVVREIPSKSNAVSGQQKLDYWGSITLTLSIVLLLIGLNSGGNQVPWGHPLVWSTISSGGILLAVFVYVEARVAADPILPLHLMLQQTVWSGCFTYFFAHMAALALMYYIPIYLQVQGNDPTQAGLRFVPQSIGTAIGAYGTGLLIKETGNYVYLSALAHVFLVASAALSATLGWDTPAWCPFLYLGLAGLGFGAMLVTTMLALISSVEHAQHAVVTSASFAFRGIGSSVGITIASAIFQNTLLQRLHERLDGIEDVDQLIELVRRNFGVIRDLPLETRAEVEDGYMTSLHWVFLAILGMSVSSMVCSLMMKQNVLHNNLKRR